MCWGATIRLPLFKRVSFLSKNKRYNWTHPAEILLLLRHLWIFSFSRVSVVNIVFPVWSTSSFTVFSVLLWESVALEVLLHIRVHEMWQILWSFPLFVLMKIRNVPYSNWKHLHPLLTENNSVLLLLITLCYYRAMKQHQHAAISGRMCPSTLTHVVSYNFEVLVLHVCIFCCFKIPQFSEANSVLTLKKKKKK